ncbi:hypothetical protein TEA_019271 [Camellia sinensis var. sinensis]|uniref:DUF641 domain-containing protein n=1 Tax=Camellia sinensis var. sinensis TaxID=542762 RepID=A0A4S4F2Q2_CAMSN|nr:hypothetical protein TEA_019271 [Camellia sinensis var. sinensis]
MFLHDRFLVTVKQPLSPVKLITSNISTEAISPHYVEKAFDLVSEDMDLLQNKEYDVQVWCIHLNDKVPFRMQWPLYTNLQVNGVQVKTFKRPESQLLGANGRDDGPMIASYVRKGTNQISLSVRDARRFCLGVRLVKKRTIEQPSHSAASWSCTLYMPRLLPRKQLLPFHRRRVRPVESPGPYPTRPIHFSFSEIQGFRRVKTVGLVCRSCLDAVAGPYCCGYEIMGKKLDSQLKLKNSEITFLQEKLEEANRENKLLEKRLNSSGLISVPDNLHLSGLSPNHFIVVLQQATKSIRNFARLMINEMELAGWNLDAAANTIEPGILNLILEKQNCEPFEDALARVCRCIGGGVAMENEDSDSDLEVIVDCVTVNLRCPWQCPICMKNYSLEDITIDPYFNHITKMVKYCGDDTIEIDVKPDGSWRAKNVYQFKKLEQWHLPDEIIYVSTPEDGSTCVSMIELDGIGNFNLSANNGHEINTVPNNFDATTGTMNRYTCPSLGGLDVIVLSDSEEENANFTYPETASITQAMKNGGHSFSVPSGTSNVYPEDPALDHGNDIEIYDQAFASGTRAGSQFQLFHIDNVSDALIDSDYTPVTSAPPIDGYALTSNCTIDPSRELVDSSVCHSDTEINDILVSNPMAFIYADPPQLFILPTQPPCMSVQCDLGNKPQTSNGFRGENLTSFGLGSNSSGGNNGATSNQLDLVNQFESDEGLDFVCFAHSFLPLAALSPPPGLDFVCFAHSFLSLAAAVTPPGLDFVCFAHSFLPLAALSPPGLDFVCFAHSFLPFAALSPPPAALSPPGMNDEVKSSGTTDAKTSSGLFSYHCWPRTGRHP